MTHLFVMMRRRKGRDGQGQEEEQGTGKGEEDFASKPVLPKEVLYLCRAQTQRKPLKCYYCYSSIGKAQR